MANGIIDEVISNFQSIEDSTERSEKIKDVANKYFNGEDSFYKFVIITLYIYSDESYDIAAELYSKCIELNSSIATYYGNRSMAYMRKELYGLALADADVALELDPNYIKAYFRRASANMALGKFKLALADYDTVCFSKLNGNYPSRVYIHAVLIHLF